MPEDTEPEIKYGTVRGYNHTPGSGLATLVVDLDDGGIELIHGDHSPISHIAEDFPPGAAIGFYWDHAQYQQIIVNPAAEA